MHLKQYWRLSIGLLIAIASFLASEKLRAQSINTTQAQSGSPAQPNLPPPSLIRPTPTLPEPQPPGQLPPPQNLLQTAPYAPTPAPLPNAIAGRFVVKQFRVVGSTVFSPQTLATATAEFTNKSITFAEVLQASAAITKLYTDKGYITSGAFIPANQTFKTRGGIVTIQVIEGTLEAIQVDGTRRLNPNYIRRRLAIGADKPLNVNRLLKALQLLQLNPLIKNISAELAAGSSPGTSLLEVKVAEAETLSAQLSLNNNRDPSVGSFERQVQLNQANLLGNGDELRVAYANTVGSNEVDVSYTLPLNPRNGTLQLAYTHISSHITESPFDTLDINGTLQDFNLTLRQPVIQTTKQEFALGLNVARRESNIGFLQALNGGEQLPFPEPGTDRNGNTRLSILRFFQEYTGRNSKQVIAARSQFSLGINAFNSTINKNPPDGSFFAWRGQAQLVRLLAPDTLVIVRTDVQLADRALVPLEQVGVGGQETVRGYRQNLLLADNAFVTSAEIRVPILRIPKIRGVLQITPFVDVGTISNNFGSAAQNPSTIASAGVGLQWQQGDRLTARFDYGIPIVPIPSKARTLQEQGFYFSVVYNLFSF